MLTILMIYHLVSAYYATHGITLNVAVCKMRWLRAASLRAPQDLTSPGQAAHECLMSSERTGLPHGSRKCRSFW